MAEAHIELSCGECGQTVTFAFADSGTVQNCPECGCLLDVPEATREPTIDDQQLEIYHATNLRQQQQYQRQLDGFDHVLARQQENSERAAQLLDRWHALAERLERLLSDWERRGGVEPPPGPKS